MKKIKITAGSDFVLAENLCLCFEFFRLKLLSSFIDVAKNMVDSSLQCTIVVSFSSFNLNLDYHNSSLLFRVKTSGFRW